MITDEPGETPFAQELVALTEEAVNLHYKMSGKPTPPDEKFIRDWIAVKLFKSQRRQIMMEVASRDFWSEVAKRMPAAGEYKIFPRGGVDMVIFGKGCAEEPFAIIELKLDARRNNSGSITNDIRRTSGLLTVCKPDVLGYQLVCVVTKQWDMRRLADGLRGSVRDLGATCGEIEAKEFEMEKDGQDIPWCGIHVVPVHRG